MNDINYRKIVKFSPAVILLSENLQLFVPYRAFVLRYIKLCKYTLYQAQRFHLSYEYFFKLFNSYCSSTLYIIKTMWLTYFHTSINYYYSFDIMVLYTPEVSLLIIAMI